MNKEIVNQSLTVINLFTKFHSPVCLSTDDIFWSADICISILEDSSQKMQ